MIPLRPVARRAGGGSWLDVLGGREAVGYLPQPCPAGWVGKSDMLLLFEGFREVVLRWRYKGGRNGKIV